ncbi:hypothetical protein [Mucilaginibacter celer]|nr:hypothetical protein [Mucilaginibacter celer]
MITSTKLAIYSKYHGDGDMWVRLGTLEEKLILGYDDWKLIDSLTEDLNLSKNVKTSREYQDKLQNTIAQCCDNAATIAYLIQIASEH